MNFEQRIVIDGNDGVGKTTLVKILARWGFRNVLDRGEMTDATDRPAVKPKPYTAYILLVTDPAVSLYRLRKRGADMDDPYHQPKTLEHYDRVFRELAETSFAGCLVVDTTTLRMGDTVKAVLRYLAQVSDKPIRIGIADGRLSKHAPDLFGLDLDSFLLDREVAAKDPAGAFMVVRCRTKSYPAMVALGSLDVAVVGSDVLAASPHTLDLEVFERFPQQGVRMCLAGQGGAIPPRMPLRVATPYPEWASRVLGERGIPHATYAVSGGSEGLVAQGIADVIFDIVESGETLRANGLEVIEDFGPLDVCLIRRKVS